MRWLIFLRKIDGILLGVTILLVLFGIATLYSIAINGETDDMLRVNKQIAFALIGIVLAIAVSIVDYRMYGGFSNLFFVVAVVLLVAVLFLGTEIRGTRGWFVLGGIQLQPVEFVKICFVVWWSHFLVKRAHKFNEWPTLILATTAIAILIGLVLLQPDLGSALVLVAAWIGGLALTNMSWKQWLAFGVLGLLVLIIGWNVALADYQKSRLSTFLHPTEDPLGEGYNVTQSIIAIGSGKFFGRGLGLGSQSQLNFLPEQETDFIFAVIAEELGFIGASVVLALFALLFWRMTVLMKNARDDFAVILAFCVLIVFFFQVVVNVGMNLGLMPVTGIPLPFLSAGGSSLVSMMILVGLLQSIKVREKKMLGSP
jgi:rod shape determining protein RodA